MIYLYIVLFLIANALIGGQLCHWCDTKDRHFFNWYKRQWPWTMFIVLQLWPVMLTLMLIYRIRRMVNG